MDLAKLWIGDEVKILTSGKIGKYEGLSGGQAKVLVEGLYQLHPAEGIELYEAQPVEEDLSEILEIRSPKSKKDPGFTNSLDLHLAKLPNYSPDSGQSILDYQLNQCQLFIKEIIKRKMSSATIIHGKGAGVLKQQVLQLLAGYPQVRVQQEKNEGGAVEVLLFY
jgi:dsDNA-specific endonuclease/ATPase MutS2